MNIFVTGGSGFVGGHLIERLVRDGHRVHALARSHESRAVVAGYGANPISGDLHSLAAGDLAGMDAVIHCAARAEDWGSREAFFSANVEGTRKALEAARAAGVRRFIHVGTEAAFFVGEDLLDLDESAPYPVHQRFLYSESKAEAERLVLAANSPEMATLSIRPRLVWGPRDGSVLPTVLAMAKAGSFAWIDGGRHQTSTCHVDNLVEALVLALTRGEGGHAWFITDGEVRSVREVLTGLAATQGVTLPSRSMPASLARMLAALVEGTWNLLKLKGKPPMTRFAISMMGASITVRDDAARRDLGWKPVRSFQEGLRTLTPSPPASADGP